MPVPVVCPHCYKSIPSPVVGADGQIRCDGCGHPFPTSGAAAANFAPPAYKPVPNYQPSFPAAATAPPPGKYQPVYPPASGPQTTGNPGLVACGIIALFGVMGLVCCGAAGIVVYGLGNQPLANQGIEMPAFNPPPFNPPNFNPPNFNPPIAPQPFPAIPPPVFPEFPQIEPAVPFDPAANIPGTPAPPVPTPPAAKTLDDFLQAMQTIDTMAFTARQMLEEFNQLPVDDARRAEVVEALLKLLDRAGVHAGGLLAGPGQTTLDNWITKAEATKVAEFAAGDTNYFARRQLLQQLAKIGGDAETAKALLPLMNDPVSTFTLPEVFAKIGPEAEDALLSQLDASEIPARRALYASLAKVGGKKSAEKLQAKIKAGEGFDRVFGAQALHEIKSRESSN